MRKGKIQMRPALDDNDLIQKLYDDNRKKDAQIQELVKDFRTLKEKPNTAMNALVEKLNLQIMELREHNQQKTYEIRRLRNEVSQLKSPNVMNLFKQYLSEKGMTRELYDLVCTHYVDFEATSLKESSQVSTEIKVSVRKNTIGYCTIENDKHYVLFLNGAKEELKDLPEKIYLTEGQFILVDENFSFKWAYPSTYEKSDGDFNLKSFALTVQRGTEFLLDKGRYPFEKISRIPMNMQLRDQQIVGIDGTNNILRYYKNIKQNIDLYMESAKIRGHQLFYVLKCFPNGLHLRNIETGEESFLNMTLEGKNIQEQQMLILSSDGEFIRTIANSRFYTTSSYYKKADHGVVEMKDSMTFVRKISGELVIVNNIPPTLTLIEGQSINVDEFNNYLSMNYSLSTSLETETKRPISVTIRRPRSLPKIDLNKSVLVLGNKAFDNTYKLTLMRYGYKTEVIEGYEPWSKIQPLTKENDIIVVVVSHISHENMWRVKGEILDKPVIYAEYDGANRIVEYLQNIEEEKVSS